MKYLLAFLLLAGSVCAQDHDPLYWRVKSVDTCGECPQWDYNNHTFPVRYGNKWYCIRPEDSLRMKDPNADVWMSYAKTKLDTTFERIPGRWEVRVDSHLTCPKDYMLSSIGDSDCWFCLSWYEHQEHPKTCKPTYTYDTTYTPLQPFFPTAEELRALRTVIAPELSHQSFTTWWFTDSAIYLDSTLILKVLPDGTIQFGDCPLKFGGRP